jgi:hypothetical protein
MFSCKRVFSISIRLILIGGASHHHVTYLFREKSKFLWWLVAPLKLTARWYSISSL